MAKHPGSLIRRMHRIAGRSWEEAKLLPRQSGIVFSRIHQLALLVAILLLLPVNLSAEPTHSNVVCREDLSETHRDQLAKRLRRITGWPELKFDRSGFLRRGNAEPVGGSQTARDLVTKAIYGTHVVVLEDAGKQADVAFCRVLPGKWKNHSLSNLPAHVVQIDFADFEQVLGDERALDAFNVGWGLLHEFDHIINDSPDAISLSETGECEAHINQMRRECDLPERVNYFYTLLPLSADTAFATRLVRLAFDQVQPSANKKKRYWVLWDANVVGGLDVQKQVASLR
jgi:hypothetical protein